MKPPAGPRPVFLPVLLAVLCLCVPVLVFAEWQIEYSATLMDELRRQGHPVSRYNGHYASEAACRSALAAMAAHQGFNVFGNEAWCVDRGGPSTGGGAWVPPVSGGSSEDFARQMVMGFIGAALQAALAPPDDSAGQAAAQARAAEAARLAAQARAARAERWRRLEHETAGRREAENRQLAALLDVGPPVEGAGADGLGLYVPEAGAARGRAALDRARCAASLAAAALRAAAAGDAARARALDRQAADVMAGEGPPPAGCAGPEPDVPAPPAPSPAGADGLARYRSVMAAVQKDLRDIEAIDRRLADVAAQRQAAERKKAEAASLLSGEAAGAGRPGGNGTVRDRTDLEARARALLREAESELAAADRDDKALREQRSAVVGRLSELKARLQAGGAGGGAAAPRGDRP
ncbi:hypothetical protein G3N55_09520 [Dissulfurirhabdus thermomarina]|uniref:Uncharacterized protein n=1 Tax=Dissulfurirhabdus thermomarina TaxID=1765737 RepID=A0A6N9TPI6_DISTH|nr:hypothetical protein [Dissulfurirhabdus thermomarina]NDY43079.1 hypothetical protein [Dissulfurirhabdus thermomarina]